MEWEEVLEHYSRKDVKHEIAEYCNNRWVALHCEEVDQKGNKVMLRYDANRRPLRISLEDNVQRLLSEHAKYKSRAIYASAHIYRTLESRWDVINKENIVASSPTLDIDSKDGDWRDVIKKAMEIIRMLEKYGIFNPVFFKWSGKGAHVHIHQEAFSEEIRRRIDPVDIAYSVTKFIANKVEPEGEAVVEAIIDIHRVFTAPLSLHREVDRVAVCVLPENLSEFHIDWTLPESFQHSSNAWRRFSPGEGDELAERAFMNVGPYLSGKRRKRKHKPLDKEILDTIKRLENYQ